MRFPNLRMRKTSGRNGSLRFVLQIKCCSACVTFNRQRPTEANTLHWQSPGSAQTNSCNRSDAKNLDGLTLMSWFGTLLALTLSRRRRM